MRFPDSGIVTLDRRGRHFEAGWIIKKDTITVGSPTLGSTTSEVGGSSEVPERMAKMMLNYLVAKHLSRKPGGR